MALSTQRRGRTRFTVLLLVLTAITLLTLDGRGFGPIGSARSAVLSALSPVGDAGAAIFRPIGNAWSSAFDQGDLQAENDRLTQENERLQGQVLAGQLSQQQLQQLLENEGITFTGDLPRVHARVVAGSVGNFGQTLDLDKGSSSGIGVPSSAIAARISCSRTRPCSAPGTQRRRPSSASMARARWLYTFRLDPPTPLFPRLEMPEKDG